MAATTVFILLVLISIVSAHGGGGGNFGQWRRGGGRGNRNHTGGIFELYHMLNLSNTIIGELNNYTIAMDLTDFDSQIKEYISEAANVTAAQNLYAIVGPPASLITAVNQMTDEEKASYAGFKAENNFTELYEALKTLICDLPTTDQNQAKQFLFAAFRSKGGPRRNGGGASGNRFGGGFGHGFGRGRGRRGGRGGFCNATIPTTGTTSVFNFGDIAGGFGPN
jgi:hypothetical protein